MIEAFRASVDHFAHEHVHARRIDAAKRIPPEVLAGLAELGVFGITIPEDFGGAGLGLPEACAIVTTLARHDRSVATTVGLHLGLGTRGLVAFGSDALRRAWLPDLAAGRKLAAFATTEAGAGSDLAAIRTRATVTGDGDGAGFVLDGEKIYVTNGGIAQVYTVTASTPGLGGARKGHSLMLVSRDDAGVAIGAEEDKLGLRGSSTTTVYLEGVRLPAERLIGAPGEGMTQLGHVLAWGRTVLAAGCVGGAGAALDATMAHVATRKQFGRTLDAFEVVREQVAEMSAVRFAMAALVQGAATGDALLFRSIAAKVFCSEGNWNIADAAIQLHGGVGYIEETGLALLLRDARVTRIFEGANDVLRVHLGLLEATTPPPRPSLRGVSPLGRVADAFHANVEDVRTHLVGHYGIRLSREQRHLHRLGQLAVLRDACDATVLAAAREGTPAALDLATHWLSLARIRSAALLPDTPPRPDVVDRIAGATHA